ncbi:dihydroorotate dehydrogenase electron transfer subunit [Bacteroidota bacterium]
MIYSKKFIRDLEIIDFKWLNNEFFIIDTCLEEDLPKMHPGQFVEVLIKDNNKTFLRRPLSIHDVDYSNNILTFLIQVVGPGTKTLSELKKGDKMNTIFPLGNSYSIPPNGSKCLLIGGGCGVAPLLLLAREMAKQKIEPTIIIGGRSKDYLLRVDEYKKYGNVYITTEDGSEGDKGFVIHSKILWDESQKFDKIYTCGPEPMMKAVAKYAAKNNIECEVSLENLMACGIGACLCCIVETKSGNKCTCTEGPVFNISDLTWLT